MKALLSGLMATMLAASFAIASAMPLDAAAIYAPQSEQMRADVVKVHNPWRGRHWRADRRWARRHARRDRYYYGDPYYSYRPRYYQRYYPRYYRPYYPRYYRRPGVTLWFNF